jgi:hypothetical protein
MIDLYREGYGVVDSQEFKTTIDTFFLYFFLFAPQLYKCDFEYVVCPCITQTMWYYLR